MGKKILVVDDSPPVRSFIGYNLKQFSFEIVYAEDGMEAMVFLKKIKPDLIFLDINLPKMNGYVLCRKIKTEEKTKDVPVILVSQRDTDWDKTWGEKAGADGYITKPFDAQQIVEVVKKYFPTEAENIPG